MNWIEVSTDLQQKATGSQSQKRWTLRSFAFDNDDRVPKEASVIRIQSVVREEPETSAELSVRGQVRDSMRRREEER